MHKQDIQLTLTLEEVNHTLGALGNLPYAQVFTLIEKIKTQAEEQVTLKQKNLKVGN